MWLDLSKDDCIIHVAFKKKWTSKKDCQLADKWLQVQGGEPKIALVIVVYYTN